MAFNGSGVFVINSSGQPVVANTVISSTVFNALTADLATGLSTCITKDGQTTPTANIPMGTFKFTNLGNGSAATDSATLGQVQASTTKLVTVTGTDTITGTMTPALTAYASGQMFYFVAAGANTGAVTLNIDGLGARNVTRHGSVALVAGDILSGEVCVVVYDGTRFQLLNPASYTNLNVTGVLSLAAGTALLPSLAFSGDPNTGLWSPAADTLAASTGGSERLRVDSSGNVGIGTTNPSFYSGRLTIDGGNLALASAGRSLFWNAGGSGVAAIQGVGTNELAFQTSGSYTERMRLDSSGNLGIGTASPAQRLDVTGAVNSVQARFGNVAGRGLTIGTTTVSGTNDAGVVFDAPVTSDGTLIFQTVSTERMRITGAGNIVAGASAALATNATNGFLYVPTCAGTPTGTPTAITGMAPIVVNTTNNKLYFYSGGAWRDAGP